MTQQLWMADVISDAFRGVKGFRVETYSGWKTRSAGSFEPLGVMNHHTGGGGYDNLLNYMMKGSSIAPLCNIATSRPQNGVVRITICTAGRANHAGLGELPWIGRNIGNYRTIGIENQNNGGEAWPAQQVEGIHILSASLMRYLKAPVDRLVDHKTYAPTRKVDRYATNVNDTRRAVTQIIKNWEKPEPILDEWEVFWMSLNDNEKAILKDFIGAIEEEGTNARSFVKQLLAFHRTERGRLQEFLEAIDYMNSSPSGQGRAVSAIWREATARGWLTDFDKFRENRKYTHEDLTR